MKEIVLDLLESQAKPVLRLYNMNILLDTGADIPVCYLDGKVLTESFNAKKIHEDLPIGTFGLDVVGDVYAVEVFSIDKLIYPGLKFFLPKYTEFDGKRIEIPRRSEYGMILSATMFDRLIYLINKQAHTFTVTIPQGEQTVRNIVIKDSTGKDFVLSGFDALGR